MNQHDVDTLLDYHYWARDRVLDAAQALSPEQFLRDLGSSFPSVRDTLVHTYGAEWVWHSRWRGTSPTALPGAAQFPDVASIRRNWSDLEVQVREFVVGLGDSGLTRSFQYKSLGGLAAQSLFWHMVQHIVNHASYHRGQVTTMLRQLGFPPAKATDLIQFYRERESRA